MEATDGEPGGEHFKRYKVILVGEVGVGKTSIFRRIKDGTFQEGTFSTLGIDEFTTTHRLRDSGAQVRLQLWDTAGSERYRAITKSYYSSANAIVFVFSLDRSASLISLKYWIDDARTLAPADALYVFVCNKVDLPDEEQVIYDKEINTFFQAPGMEDYQLYRSSAKNNSGIQDVVDAVLAKLERSSQQQQQNRMSETVRLNSQEDPLNPQMPPTPCQC